MGEAMLSAVLSKGLSQPQAISVSDISQSRRQHLEQKYGVATMNDNRQAIKRGDIVVLAIKPQNLAEVMAALNGQLKSAQLVLSIIAGARIDTLRRGLNHNCVVRAMPNTPAQIDMATAVSGSGPAYIFLFAESLIEAAVHIGLPRDMAQELVVQTLSGSGHFLRKSGKQPLELRKMVTSPGGTTAEALLQLEKGKFTELVKQAVEAAYNKAKRLGE